MIAPKRLALLNDNPIVQAELLHHKRASVPAPRWRRWLVWGIYIVALEMAMIYFWGEFAGALLWRYTTPFYEGPIMGVLSAVMLIVAVAAHVLVMLRTLALAATSIVQEKQRGTWDILVLTGVTPRQLVIGKWWATLRTMGRSYLGLALLRSGVAVWIGATAVLPNFLYMPYLLFPPHPLLILLAGVLTLLFTLMAAALTAAIGVLASLAARRLETAAVIAVILVVALVIVTALSWRFFSLVSYFGSCPSGFDDHICNGVDEAMDLTVITLVDNGTLATSNLAQHLIRHAGQELAYQFPDDTHITWGNGMAAVFIPGFYLLTTGGLLRLAEWRVRRQVMLPKTA